jgi:hypothetical protein
MRDRHRRGHAIPLSYPQASVFCALFVRNRKAAMEEPDDLLLFAPVPLQRVTANGWTAERQRAFIAALARMGVVSHAARSVGKTARSAYQLRQHADQYQGFVPAWNEAMNRSHEEARNAALRCVSEPETVPIIRRGKVIGWRRRFNERMIASALRVIADRHRVLDYNADYHDRRRRARVAHYGSPEAAEAASIARREKAAEREAEQQAKRDRREWERWQAEAAAAEARVIANRRPGIRAVVGNNRSRGRNEIAQPARNLRS